MKLQIHLTLIALCMSSLEAWAGMNGYILPPASPHAKSRYVKKGRASESSRERITPTPSTVTAPAADAPTTLAESDDVAYLVKAKESAVAMLIKATKRYNEKTITKDQYIEIALQCSQMADYVHKASIVDRSTSVAGAINTLIPNSTPNNPPTISQGSTVTGQPTPVPNVNEVAPWYDPVTKIVSRCPESDVARGCKVGLYRSNVGSGGYFPLPDPVITIGKSNPVIPNGSKTTISWTVAPATGLICDVIDGDTKNALFTTNGAGDWETPPIEDRNRIPAKTYNVQCRYPSGQYSYAMAQISVNGAGTAYERVTAPTPPPTPAAPPAAAAPTAPAPPPFVYGDVYNTITGVLVSRGGGLCTPYPYEQFPNCEGGCGPCPARNNLPAQPSTWTYTGAGRDGGCQPGFKIYWTSNNHTGFTCDVDP